MSKYALGKSLLIIISSDTLEFQVLYCVLTSILEYHCKM